MTPGGIVAMVSSLPTRTVTRSRAPHRADAASGKPVSAATVRAQLSSAQQQMQS